MHGPAVLVVHRHEGWRDNRIQIGYPVIVTHAFDLQDKVTSIGAKNGRNGAQESINLVGQNGALSFSSTLKRVALPHCIMKAAPDSSLELRNARLLTPIGQTDERRAPRIAGTSFAGARPRSGPPLRMCSTSCRTSMVDDRGQVLVGIAVIGLAVAVGVVAPGVTEVIPVGLAVIGLCVALQALVARERTSIASSTQSRRSHRLASIMMVVVASVGGFLGAGGDEVVWCSAAVLVALIIWWCNPGMMSTPDRRPE